MKKRIKILLLAAFAFGTAGQGSAAAQARGTCLLQSPDGRLGVEIRTDSSLAYRLLYDGNVLLDWSGIGLLLDDGTQVGRTPRPRTIRRSRVAEDTPARFYRQNRVALVRNELSMRLEDGFGVRFCASDEGMAYRFFTTRRGTTTVQDERAEMRFANGRKAWMAYTTNDEKPLAMAFQNTYTETTLPDMAGKPAFLPVAVDCGTAKLTLLDVDVERYPGMFVERLDTAGGPPGLKARFAPYPARTDYYPWRKQRYVAEAAGYIARTDGPRDYPWRVWVVTTDDRQMPAANLPYVLASPSRVGDTGWIMPGKAAWEWWNDWNLRGVPFEAGINMETYRHYIDFASQNGLEYVVLDEGWYDPAGGDMLAPVAALDLPALAAYARERGVRLILWTVYNVLDDRLEEICRHYAAMGIAGFKVDFLDRDDQEAVEMVYRICEAAARHHLVLDLHGIYKPTGLTRTWPNVLNMEAVFGMEEVKWTAPETDMPRYDVTFPYLRMMPGPVDYTPGAMRNATRADWRAVYSRPMSMGTRCHQLAAYVVYDSPLSMLCDAPSDYREEAECAAFIASLPQEADTTFVAAGKLGEYIATVRRSGSHWYAGGMTGWDGRDIELPLHFLEEGAVYRATLFCDGPNAHRNAGDYACRIFAARRDTTLHLHLAPGGGFALKMERLPARAGVTAVPQGKGIPDFYGKYAEAGGLYVTASGRVDDEALRRAAAVIGQMLAKRPDVEAEMARKGCHVMVIGRDEETCDLPEFAHICNSPDSIAYWNRRARGFGGAPEDTYSSSCGEENLLCLPGDRYKGENILVHEFAHLIHTIGICGVEPGFNARLEALMEEAARKGLWKDTYAMSNKEEYFAECVQSFFNCNRRALPADGVHNGIDSRSKLKNYDPGMYMLLKEYFFETDILYNDFPPSKQPD